MNYNYIILTFNAAQQSVQRAVDGGDSAWFTSIFPARPKSANANRWAAMNAIAQVYVEELEYWQW